MCPGRLNLTFWVRANREICEPWVSALIHGWFSLVLRMGEAKENDVYEEELLDYEEDDDKTVDGSAAKPTGEVAKKYALSYTSTIIALTLFSFNFAALR